jgi:hypothetical protein
MSIEPTPPPIYQPMVLQNPFPLQGLVTTYSMKPHPNQPSTSNPPGNPLFQNIYFNLMYVNLQT